MFWETTGTFWEKIEEFEKKMEEFEKTMEEFEKTMGRIWENNGEHFGNKWNILRKKWHFEKKVEHFEKFWEKIIFFGIPPFTLVFALSFATWRFWEKNGTFWEILRKKWNILRKIRVQPEPLGGPFAKNPTDLVPLLCAWASAKNFWEIYVSPGLPLV